MNKNNVLTYYWLKNNLDSKITGKNYNQLEILNDDYGNQYSYGELSDTNRLEKITTIFELKKGAILTDVLFFGINYFIINTRTKLIFEKHGIRDTYFIPLKVIENTSDNWYVMYTPYSIDSVELIDFDKTIFHLTDPFGEITFEEYKIEKKSIDKAKEYLKLQQNAGFEQYIQIKELALNTDAIGQIDLFYLSPFHIPAILISSNLKKALEIEKITGLKFIEQQICR